MKEKRRHQSDDDASSDSSKDAGGHKDESQHRHSIGTTSSSKKKSKKSKKSKSSKKERHRNDSGSEASQSESDSPEAARLRRGKPRITKDDYFTKSTEFIVWLKESKNVFFSDLSTKESHSFFKKFIKKWNRGKLNVKYYNGINSSELASNDRSSFKWKIKSMTETEASQLDEVKDSVYGMTTSSKVFLEPIKRKVTSESSSSLSRGPSSSGSNNIPLGDRSSARQYAGGEEDMDEEDRRRYEVGLMKKDRKTYQKVHENAIEEMMPKATGREAQIEKRKIINQYHKQERDIDASFADGDLMGGGDSFQAALERDRRRKEKMEERRRGPAAGHRGGGSSGGGSAALDERVQMFNAKEDATMKMLRGLAEARYGSGTGQ